MVLTGALNFSSETAQPQIGMAKLIRDARHLFSIQPPEDAQTLLLNDRGVLLTHAPSSVLD